MLKYYLSVEPKSYIVFLLLCVHYTSCMINLLYTSENKIFYVHFASNATKYILCRVARLILGGLPNFFFTHFVRNVLFIFSSNMSLHSYNLLPSS